LVIFHQEEEVLEDSGDLAEAALAVAVLVEAGDKQMQTRGQPGYIKKRLPGGTAYFIPLFNNC
jgi:hypothetical protein